VYSAFFEVPNKVPRIDAVNATVVHPSCGRDNGSISGIQLFDMEFSTRGWYNEAGALISSSLDLRNAAPGKYKLVVKDNTGACGDSTTYFTLNIVPAPGMNTSSAQVADASCGRTDGSIRGITLSTGTASYWWVNGSGAVVATTADLLNVGPGSYRLKVRDGSNCDTLFSPVYNIADRGSVSLDETMLTVTPTGCTKVAGAIKGIRISGANSLEWRNTVTGVVVGNTADIIGLPAGSYQLTAVNTTYGCSLKSGVYIVQVAPPLDLKVLADEVENASCGLNNGLIRLLQFNNNESYFTFRWLRDSITPVGTSLSLTNLPPATYYAIATDTNGCDIPFYKKTITALALPRLNEAAAAVTADTCQFTTGSISGLVATSDEPGLQYSWRTLTDQPVGDGPQLNNVTAGDYYLLVTDARGCSVRSRNYNVPSINATLAAPRYTASFDIARNSSLSFSPAAGARAGTYSLYDRATGALLAENTTGSFSLAAIAVDRELYVVFSAGPCTSREAVIRIKVYDETKLTIPNAFSPNGDGINDAFRVQVIGLFHLRSMKIFNRYGQMVHEIRDLNQPWDGKRNGTPLPVGTYYWLIDGFDMHNRPLKQSGSITLIR
jgi:gliding motility-associated-like protein